MANKTQERREFAGQFEEPEKYVGYAVCDPQGCKIGHVERLFVNDSHEPEYIRVKMGLLGLKSALIPVTSAAADEKRRTLTLQ